MNVHLKRTVEIELSLTPEEIAAAWCNLDADGQARFFNEIKNLSAHWSGPLCMQMQYVQDSPLLTNDGRAVMSLIGDYSR